MTNGFTCSCLIVYLTAVQEFTCNFEVDNDPNCYFHNALSDHFDWQRNTVCCNIALITDSYSLT